MWKKVLIGCSVAAAVVMLLIAVSGFFIFRQLAKVGLREIKMPVKLEHPSVVTGSEIIRKTVFLEDAGIGEITDIAVGELDASPGIEIGIAGTRGCLFLDTEMGHKSRVVFGEQGSHIDIVDVDGDGICEFMDRGSWGNDASLIDHAGRVLWTYGGMPGVDDMDAGDIDGDGAMEFAVGFNGSGGVHLVDESGRKVWRKPDGNVWHVEMVDTNGDGRPEIVHSNAGGEMKVRNKEGEVVKTSRPEPYFSSFSLCRWPTSQDREYALLAEDNTIWLFDFDGNVGAQFTAPYCGRLGEARGTPVRLIGNQPEYLAVLINHRNWERAVLYIYDSSRELIYHETLPSGCPSVAAISLDDDQTQALLVGGQGIIYRYRPEDTADTG